MTRILAAIASTWILFGAAPVSAGGQLAVGEVVPLYHPPGYVIRPVYTPPVLHSRWTPADTSYGVVFREPLYRARPGYVYRYVRGYTRQRIAASTGRTVYKARVSKPAAKASTVSVKKIRRGSCVTELGYGRYDVCP